MNQKWAAWKTYMIANGGADPQTTGEDVLYLTAMDTLINGALNPLIDKGTQGAALLDDWLNDAVWIVPYLESCGNIAGGYYTGSDYTNILAFMHVTDDWKGDDTAYNTYAKPHVDSGRQWLNWVRNAGFTPSQGVPTLPADYTAWYKRALDNALPSIQIGGGIAAGLFVVGGVLLLYLFLSK
jgi:hypothetical protein